MELRHLRTFQVVAEQLNLTKAAEQLGYSQPGITLQIKALEKEIGRPLFTRVGRQNYLTPAGKLLKHHADRLLAVMGELDDDLRKLDIPYGPLVVSSPEFYCTRYMPGIIGRYLKDYPQVRLQMISCNSVETTKLVCAHQADVGIIAGDCLNPDLEVVPIGEEDFVLLAAPELLAGRDKQTLLHTVPFLKDGMVEKIGGNLYAEIDFKTTTIIEFGSEAGIKQAALSQTGCCVLGEAIVEEEIAAGKLVVLHRFAKKLRTSLIYLKERNQEAAIRAFVAMTQEMWDDPKT